jgi:cell division protein FtsW
MNFQPSEFAKLAVIIYASDYMVRKMEVKERFFRGCCQWAPLLVWRVCCCLPEPDMGASLVIAIIAMGILSLGGVNARMFFLILAILVFAFAMIIAASPGVASAFLPTSILGIRRTHLGKGYQLSHSLIAIGRGEIFGVGLGGSVEKLHWLPEAHTDFLLAVSAKSLAWSVSWPSSACSCGSAAASWSLAAKPWRWTAPLRAWWRKVSVSGLAFSPSLTWV